MVANNAWPTVYPGNAMTHGFLLGKFMPPHNGHVLLCEFAAAYVDTLTILVCSLPDDPIPGALRHRWMNELFPRARVVHLDRANVPQAPEDHAEFWNIWRNIVREFDGQPIDHVFASESYGHRLAQEVDARFVPFDIARSAAPVSGTAVRADPFSNWRYLPPPVRAHFAKRVCVFGPESSGKTTLANDLAKALDTICVPEYGRIYTENFGVDCNAGDLRRIAEGHIAATQALLKHANKLLICDTDPVLTALWSQMLLGRRDPALDGFADHADLYLLTDIDMPWVDDGTRYFSDTMRRKKFFDLCRAELERRQLPYVLVSGSPPQRLQAGLAAIDAHFLGLRR